MFKILLTRLKDDCRGGTAIEYGLIAALIVVASLFSMQAFAGESTLTWNNIAQKVSDAISPAAG